MTASAKPRKSKATWNSAIREARRQLVLAKRRVEGLERTVQNWTRLRDQGMPWPGTKEEAMTGPHLHHGGRQ